MREFTILIGQLFSIVLLQFILEQFIDKDERPTHVKILSIACIMGSMYLLLQFAFEVVLPQISALVTFTF